MSIIYIIFYISLLSIKNVESFLPFIKIILEVINAYAVIVTVFKVFSKMKEIKFLILCGKESLVIYLLHTYFVTAIKAFIIRNNFSSAGILTNFNNNNSIIYLFNYSEIVTQNKTFRICI